MERKNILVLGAKVPYTSGGQEALVKSLVKEIAHRGHNVDTLEIPFNPSPQENLLTQAALWRTVDFTNFSGEAIDLVIATKFPSYFAKHPRKSVWLVHQHRPCYDLYGTRFSDFSDDPRDELIRRALLEADTKALSESAFISGISKNVVSRLKTFHSIEAKTLYPPLPLGNRYFCSEAKPYILFVGRLCSIKRFDYLLKALPMIHQFVEVKVVGVPDEPGVMEYYENEIKKHHLEKRISFLGRVSDEDLLSLYAQATVVFYAPYNEDYGFVTLEAFASSKPVVTAHDSGGTLEFVVDGENGVVVEPTFDAIARGCNRFFDDESFATKAGLNGRSLIESLKLIDMGWDHVVKELLSPLH